MMKGDEDEESKKSRTMNSTKKKFDMFVLIAPAIALRHGLFLVNNHHQHHHLLSSALCIVSAISNSHWPSPTRASLSFRHSGPRSFC